MAKDTSPKQSRVKAWRDQRAAKRAQRGDSPEKQRERAGRSDRPTVGENANRAGMGGFVGGGF